MNRRKFFLAAAMAVASTSLPPSWIQGGDWKVRQFGHVVRDHALAYVAAVRRVPGLNFNS